MIDCSMDEYDLSMLAEYENEGGAHRFVAPPLSNTGALRTLVDYLRFTLHDFTREEWQERLDRMGIEASAFKPVSGMEVVYALFGRHGWEVREKGNQWYTKRMVRGNITVLWDGVRDGMGTHVDISGEGCREIENAKNFVTWPYFARRVLDCGGKPSRFDLANDDNAGMLSIDEIKHYIKNGWFTTRYREWGGRWSQKLDGESSMHETLYFGDRSGQSMIRFYDWQARHGGDEKIIRCEMELHDESARKAFEMIAGSVEIGAVCTSILNGKLEFKAPTRDSNKRRWPLADWWENFTRKMSAVKLGIRKPEPDLDRSAKWAVTQWPQTAARLQEVLPDPFWFEGILERGRELLALNHKRWESIKAKGWRSDRPVNNENAEELVRQREGMLQNFFAEGMERISTDECIQYTSLPDWYTRQGLELPKEETASMPYDFLFRPIYGSAITILPAGAKFAVNSSANRQVSMVY